MFSPFFRIHGWLVYGVYTDEKVCHHVAVVREKAQYISESLDFSSLFTYTSPTDLPSASASTSNLPTLTIEDLLANPYLFDTDPNTTSSTQELSQLKETADGLMAELGVWEYGANWIPFHPRTQYGNHCYRHAMRIALLRDVYGVEDDDERVVASALAIVELGKELMVNFGHINWSVNTIVMNEEFTDELGYRGLYCWLDSMWGWIKVRGRTR